MPNIGHTRPLRSTAAPGILVAMHNDSWAHAISGLGVAGIDKSIGAQMQLEPLSQEIAEQYWRGDDILGRIVETLPREMTREGHDLRVPDDLPLAESLEDEAQRLGVDRVAREALQYARAYGGGAVFIGVEDGLPLIEPLDLDRIKAVTHLTAFTPRELQVRSYQSNQLLPGFGRPEIYNLVPWTTPRGYADKTVNTGVITPIHASRLWRFDGLLTGRSQLAQSVNPGWGDSVLTRVVDKVQAYQLAWKAIGILMQDFAPATLSMAGLADIVASGEHGSRDIARRAQALELCRSIARVSIIDSTESYKRDSVSLAGLADTLQQLSLRIASTAEMPVSLLMGQAPAGLNATGDSDIRWYYDQVRARQRNELVPYYHWLYSALFATSGGEPETWSVEPRPLWQRTANEEAALRKTVADTDVAYINAGVLTPDEVARNRFGGDAWTMETTVDAADHEPLSEDDEREDSVKRCDYIRREGKSYNVYSEAGKLLGKHPNKGRALRQLRAIEATKHE